MSTSAIPICTLVNSWPIIDARTPTEFSNGISQRLSNITKATSAPTKLLITRHGRGFCQTHGIYLPTNKHTHSHHQRPSARTRATFAANTTSYLGRWPDFSVVPTNDVSIDVSVLPAPKKGYELMDLCGA